jgi:hypothetical protein
VQQQLAAGITTAKPPKTLTVAELTSAAGSERGERLKLVLIELEKRQGDEVIGALGSAAAASYEDETQKLARNLLYRHLSRQKQGVIKEKLKDDRVEVRATAARVAGDKKMRLGDELIDLLTDDQERVRTAAHQALVSLNKGTDLGPKVKGSEKERSDAVRKWREWWAAQSGK